MKAIDEPTIDLTAKVKRLVRKRHDPQEASAKIAALGDEAVSILCSLALVEAKRRNPLRWSLLFLSMLGPMANIILIEALPRATREPYQIMAWGLFFMGTFGNLFLLSFGGRATKLLAGLDTIRVVGPLLDAMTANDRDVTLKPTIRAALYRLLPRLQASDVSLLLPRHITALNREIDFCRVWKWGAPREVEYALVVFKALEQVGDETSVPVVEHVLQTTRNEQTREAAEACLTFLRTHAAMGKHSLLRAVNSDTSDLLLPAHGGANSEPSVLLRPYSAQDNE
ncbi:MAG: hypothetical protein JWN14_3869 [Chthonomonadales bacterium]|nr:hypothetical protein [Chthonomonadales bacterium]